MHSACIEQSASVRLRRQYHSVARTLRGNATALLSSIPAAILLLATAPFLLTAIALGARLRGTPRTGRMGRRFTEYELVGRSRKPLRFLGPLMKFWNILRGEVSWVGPEARCPGELDLTGESARRVAAVRPGIICTWWVRQRTNVAYGLHLETDLDYVETRSMRADLGIAARALLALAYGAPSGRVAGQANILGLPLDNLSLGEAVEEILRPAEQTRQVSFVNVDCVNLSHRDPEYRDILRTSDLRLADGIGLRIAGRLLNSEIRQNVNGTDLFPVLCDRMEERGLRLFLLGGRPGVASDVAARIQEKHPNLVIAGTHHGCEGIAAKRGPIPLPRRTRLRVAQLCRGNPGGADGSNVDGSSLHQHLDHRKMGAYIQAIGYFVPCCCPESRQTSRYCVLDWS